MKTILTLLGLLTSLSAFSQLSISGTIASTSAANNAPAIVVDNGISITGSTTIDAAKVSVASNFSTGDVLAYTSSLPLGVTASYNTSNGVLSFSGNATPSEYQTLLRTVTFNTTSSSSLQRTITFNIGNAIAYSGNGHFYEFKSGSFSWTTAKTNAAALTFYGLHGYLATITSQAENDFIQQKTSADGWIGASDDYSYINAAIGSSTYANQAAAEGKWYWVTGPSGEIGTQFSNGNTNPSSVSSRFMNWNTSEPNNSGSNENYGQIFSSASTGKWNDLPNTSMLGYVVEYGGLSGDPAVTLTCSRNIAMIATSLQTTATSIPYQLHATAIAVDNVLVVYSTGNITDAKVTIAGNFNTGDALSFTAGSLPSGVTGSYNSSTGVLSFSGTATASQWQTLFRTVQFNSTSNVIVSRVITFSVGNLVSGSNGHFYEYVSTAGSWTTSKTNAAARTYLALHGYLATITSQNENDFIKQKLGADAWIGSSDDFGYINAATGSSTYANQAAAEGKWYWVTGPVGEIGVQFSNGNGTATAVGGNYMYWTSGEPNNSSSTEHYGEIYASGVNPGRWNDLPNTSSLGYVVEYGGLLTDPLLNLSANRTVAITSILPITGLKFSATKNSNGVELNWFTYTEINTNHFDVLYSTDGNNYNRIGQVEASGNTSTTTNYQWGHKYPAHGNNYYRLQVFDNDNRSVLSEIKKVYTGSAKITLSPNPVTSQFTISYPYSGKPVTLTVMNSIGEMQMKVPISQYETNINCKALAPGLYIAVIREHNVVTNLKFIRK